MNAGVTPRTLKSGVPSMYEYRWRTPLLLVVMCNVGGGDMRIES